ncbi:hypothetical protein GQ457_18G008940 [Hibiscus cannabinus]
MRILLIGEMTKAPFKSKAERTSDLLELIHSDVYSLMNTQFKYRFQYFNAFIYDEVETLEKFKIFRNEVQNQLKYQNALIFRYLSTKFDELPK